MRKQNVPKAPSRKPTRKSRPFFDKAELKRQALIIFIISFFVATALILYVFGFPPGFFQRLFSATFVFFLLIGVTVLGIIPLVNYVFNRWLR
jgi:membrane protein YdbS with pleckstrin-like domain